MGTSRIDELREDLHSLKRYLALLWSKKAVFIKYSLVAVVLAVVVAFSVPRIYSTTTILAMEPRQTGYNAAVMSLAGMAGINLGFLSEDAYSVDLYPTIISSKDFVSRLAMMPVRIEEEGIDCNYATYLLTAPETTWWGRSVDWVKSLFGADKADVIVDADDVPAEVVYRIRSNINCQVNKLQGLINITAYDENPLVCKALADSVTAGLNAFIQDYRTGKTRADYMALSQICDSAKVRYQEAQRRYTEFLEKNSSSNSATYKAQRDFLEGETELAYATYNQMAAQVQMALVKLQEATPVYNVIQSTYVPQKPEALSLLSTVVLFVFVAFVVATVKITYSCIKEKIWAKRA